LLPLATFVARVLEVLGIPLLGAGFFGGFASMVVWLRGGTGKEVADAAPLAAAAGFYVGLIAALFYVGYLVLT
jgi:hypothetical protein